MRGCFVAIEGPEGAGKSTLLRGLAKRAEAAGLGVKATRNPGDTALGARLRELLLDPDLPALSTEAELLLFLADRAQHVNEVLKPALGEGKLVLCDRFSASTLAYQGYGRGLPLGPLTQLERDWGALGLLPDLTLLLDLPPADGLARAQRRGVTDRLEAEALAFHERVRQGFLAQAASAPGRYHVLDAKQSADALLDAAWSVLEVRLTPTLEAPP